MGKGINVTGKFTIVKPPRILGNGEWKVAVCRCVNNISKKKGGQWEDVASFYELKFFTKKPEEFQRWLKGDVIAVLKSEMKIEISERDGKTYTNVELAVDGFGYLHEAKADRLNKKSTPLTSDPLIGSDNPFESDTELNDPFA